MKPAFLVFIGNWRRCQSDFHVHTTGNISLHGSSAKFMVCGISCLPCLVTQGMGNGFDTVLY